MDDNIVAVVAITLIFGFPVFGWIVVRSLRHVERMEMIKRGIAPPDDSRWARVFGTQQQAPPPPSAPVYVTPPSAWNQNAQCMLRKGIVTTAVGFALLVGLSFIGWRGDGSFTLGPWLLGGLIPLFVGIAQVANAVLAGAQFPRQNVTFGPIPPPKSPPPPPASSGPYAYRPGPTEELPRSKPPQTQ